ncbi:hypothetical protein BGZ65_000487, partial [Modicella reniformis]
MHGDGYDYPVKVAEHGTELEFPRIPDRTFVEISGNVYHDYFRDQLQDYSRSSTSNDSNSKDLPEDRGSQHGQNIMFGWLLGSKRNKEGVTSVNGDDAGAQDKKKGASESDRPWIWMTNIWHEGNECGPGYLRQYRMRLDHALANDDSTTWELMYTHKFPGPITHSSVSRRIIPLTNQNWDQGVDESHGDTFQGHGRESIRLAIVYKVIQDENVAHHSRVYHFGIYDNHINLEGSTPLKDFSLEYDTILYSRLGDTVGFRSLKLPILKPGAASPDHPDTLPYGVPGPSLTCRERKNMPYRASYLTKVPSDQESNDFHVMMGQVQEYTHNWDYQLSVATEMTEVVTGNKKWLTEQQWQIKHFSTRQPILTSNHTHIHKPLQRRFQSLIHENDMINDEPHTYGISIQKPYIVKSVDGSSIHIPIKDTIMSIDIKRPSNLENDGSYMNEQTDYQEGLDEGSDTDTRPHHHQHNTRQHQRERPQKRKLGAEYYLIPSWNFKGQWIESQIDIGSMETIDTIQGVINDATDMMALKTARNSILILKRQINQASTDSDDNDYQLDTRKAKWDLSMALSDSLYDPTLGNMEKREVLAMKIVSVTVPVPEQVHDTLAGENESEVERHGGKGDNENVYDTTMTQNQEDVARARSQFPQEEENDTKIPRTRIHNILFLTYGNGRMDAYDLNRATEMSSFVMFLKAKYPVVI